jgi:hypothetical protein
MKIHWDEGERERERERRCEYCELRDREKMKCEVYVMFVFNECFRGKKNGMTYLKRDREIQ